tara:strand:- start:3686 stop:4798 length:1113 start_codon:yes stop_codon:yes gene_type:complete
MTTNFFLIAAPYLHNNGNSLDIESDIFFYLKNCFENFDNKFDYARFKIDKNNKLTLDIEYLNNNLNKDHVLVIDANFSIGDSSQIYPEEMLNIITKYKNKIISIVPDLIKKTDLKTWLNISKILISFSKSGVDWSNEKFKTNKFKYYPSFPIKKIGNYTLENFKNRPYDIGYIGSNKIFRVNFLASMLRKGGNKISSLIISSFRSSDLIKSTMDYLKLMTKCKFYFCTRATFYEKYKNTPFNTQIYDGHFANRVNEAIASGCIPLYWQPKKGGAISSFLREKFFHSHSFKYNTFENTSYDKNSLPYDHLETNLLPAIKIARDSKDAIKIIRSKNDEDLNNTISVGNKLYEKYIKPKQIINFIEENLIKND